MKTFETEKGNIPEGATHYSDECESDYFAWFKSELGINYLWCPGIEGEEYWIALINQNGMYGEEVRPIPQTEEVCTEVGTGVPEWVNGDEVICTALKEELNPCMYVGKDGNLHVFKMSSGLYESTTIEFLAKPETEAERVERERESAIYDMCGSADNFTEEAHFWASKFYDLGYTRDSNNE